MDSQDEPPAKNGTTSPSPSVISSYASSGAIQSNPTNPDPGTNLILPLSPASLSQAPANHGQDGSQHSVCLDMTMSGLAVIPPSGRDSRPAGSSSFALGRKTASVADNSDHIEDLPSQDVHQQPQHYNSRSSPYYAETLMADYSLLQGQKPISNGATAGSQTLSSLQPWNPAALLNPKGRGTPQQRSASPGSGPTLGLPTQQPPQIFQFSSVSDNDNGNGFANDSNGDQQNPVRYTIESQSSTPEPHANRLSRENSSTSAYSQPQQITHGRARLTANGMGSMIERMNGVQDRSTVPMAKRQKISTDDNEGGPKYGSNSSSSGMLSSYVKEKQLAGQSMPGTQTPGKPPVLDLTTGASCPLS